MITIGAKYDGEMIIDTKIRTESAVQKLMSLENNLKKNAGEAELLASKMKKLENAKIPTEEYKAVQKQIESTRAKLSALNERMEKWVELGKSTKSNAFKSMQYDAEQLKNTMNYLQTEAQEMRNAGTAFIDPKQTEAYQKMVVRQQQLNGQQAIYKHQWQEIVNKEIQANQEVEKTPPKFERMKLAISQVGNGLMTVVKRIRNMNSLGKKSNGVFKNLLRTMKQMMLSMAVFQIMFKGLEYVTSGLKNLAVYSKEYNKTMSDFTSATAQLKNGLAVAFQPILNMVIPALTSMINHLNSASNAASRFFAILGGKSTYTKAIKQNKDYAASLDKVGDAQGALAGFDDLNVLQKNSASGGSTDGADGSGFTEETVGAPSDWTLSFKEAIEAGDWYGVGALLAEKVTGAIQMAFNFVSTYDWSGRAQALALGINGLVANIDWGLLGQSLSGGLKGLLTSATEFIRTLDFREIGRAFGEFLINVDWWGIIMSLGTLIWEAICGLWDFLCGLLEGLGIVDFVKSVMDNIRRWIEQKLALIGITLIIAYVHLKKGWYDFWNGLWEGLKCVINDIIGGVEGMANSVINAVNGMIDALNGLAFEVPEWVPVLGGNTFSPNISHIPTLNIPRLANGAVFPGGSPYMAVVNDQPFGQTNIETPLSTMVDAFKIAMADMKGTTGGTVQIVLDGKVLGTASLPYLQNEANRIGTTLVLE